MERRDKRIADVAAAAGCPLEWLGEEEFWEQARPTLRTTFDLAYYEHYLALAAKGEFHDNWRSAGWLAGRIAQIKGYRRDRQA
jgi:hypothetical protein